GALARREERRAVGRVNSLSYCRDAVLEAWERRAETARGKAAGSDADPDVGAGMADLSRRLEVVRARRPDLAVPLDSALRSLSRLSASGRPAGEVEASLARLDRRLAREVSEALREREREAVASDVKRRLAGAGDRMDPATFEKTSRALTRRTIRELLELPRLSLL